MRKLIVLLLVSFCLVGVGSANAGVLTFTPPDSFGDFGDLAHDWYYAWNIASPSLSGVSATSATLIFRNIANYSDHPENMLFVHLFDDPQTAGGIFVSQTDRAYYSTSEYQWYDGGPLINDDWASYTPLVGTWSDPIGGPDGAIDLAFTFNEEQLGYLNQYIASNGTFGFGIDPDCHFANDGVEFRVTAPVPEPTSIMLLGMGILGMFGLRKKIA